MSKKKTLLASVWILYPLLGMRLVARNAQDVQFILYLFLLGLIQVSLYVTASASSLAKDSLISRPLFAVLFALILFADGLLFGVFRKSEYLPGHFFSRAFLAIYLVQSLIIIRRSFSSSKAEESPQRQIRNSSEKLFKSSLIGFALGVIAIAALAAIWTAFGGTTTSAGFFERFNQVFDGWVAGTGAAAGALLGATIGLNKMKSSRSNTRK